MGLTGRLTDLVLDQTVGPGDANDVDRSFRSRVKQQLHAIVELAAVQAAGLDLDQSVLRQLETPHSLQPYANPAAASIALIALVAHEMHTAVRIDAGAVQPAIPVEVGIHLRARYGWKRIPAKRLHCVPAAEQIPIQHRRAIA